MFNIQKQEIEFGGRTLTLETGKIARQADGAVFAKYGDTTVLATAVAAKKATKALISSPDRSLPGKILCSRPHPRWLSQREARPSEKETLVSRSDRPPDPPHVRRRFSQRSSGYRDHDGALTRRTTLISSRSSLHPQPLQFRVLPSRMPSAPPASVTSTMNSS